MLHSSMVLMQQLSHALVDAAATGSESATPYGAPIGFGIIFVAVGALAYSGKWRSWSTSRALIIYKFAPVALGYAGTGAIVGGLAAMLPEPLAEIVGFPAMAFFLLCLLGMVWLPRFMLPRWYRIQKALEPETRLGSRKRTPPARGSLLSSGAGLGAVPPVDSAAELAFSSRIGGAVGGVEVEASTYSPAVIDAKSSEVAAEPSGPEGSPPA